MINFLHPIFTILVLILIAYSFLEVYENKKYKSIWIVVMVMIILIGFRKFVGADYPIYSRIYDYVGEEVSFSEFFNSKKERFLGVEWLYALLGKIVYVLDAPFFVFTFIIAIISIGLKYFAFRSSVVYPALSMLLYIFPSYFTSDGGHMRQGVAMGIVLLSFSYIRKRKLLSFLFMIYLAMGFHNSAFVFVVTYWLVLVPLNSFRILLLVLGSMALSPLEIYKYISLLDWLVPSEVHSGFQAYEMIEEESKGSVKLTDLICVMYTYFLVTYNKEACERIPYYEYMRNIGVMGICLYFVFRGSAIFSSRLVVYYFIYMVMVIPNIIAAIQKDVLKKSLHFSMVCFVIFYYFVYASMQAPRAGYNFIYKNYLW